MTEIEEREPDQPGLWQRFVDFPLVVLAVAVGLFLLAASVGNKLGSAIHLHSAVARMLTRNAVILLILLATYKLGIARLGAKPRDDLLAKNAWPDLGIGMLAGFLLMTLSVGVAAVAHVYNFVGEGDSSQMVPALVSGAIMPAFMEELLFRGILFRWIEEFAGSWLALLVTSALFGLVHILNPGATWFSSLAIAIEAGILLGGAYMLARSLWLPIGLHAAWNFTEGEVFDVPVSGLPEHGLVQARMSGPAILSGGHFGLEASIIALVLATAAGLWFVWRAARRGKVVQPCRVRRRMA